MIYRIDFTPQALDDLSLLDPPTARRISSKIEWLAENCERITPEPLSAKYKGLYKLRIGDWRVLYTVKSQEHVVTIHAIGHRSKVYKI
ncbi:MAG: type II toxin-antitoxin system RelE/ParE family toxin [Nitrospirae bacterium]|nr:type II toxin-antitoxin system RelE/ParE family toxin [Nitrospirota bacterium]